jgi:predicted XRE-type DNA-binding protein
VERSSRNVFADLGFPHFELELLKATLTLQIYRLVKRRELTQNETGKILGILGIRGCVIAATNLPRAPGQPRLASISEEAQNQDLPRRGLSGNLYLSI